MITAIPGEFPDFTVIKIRKLHTRYRSTLLSPYPSQPS